MNRTTIARLSAVAAVAPASISRARVLTRSSTRPSPEAPCRSSAGTSSTGSLGGGGIAAFDLALHLSFSTVSGNEAVVGGPIGGGGGIDISKDSTVTLDGSIVADRTIPLLAGSAAINLAPVADCDGLTVDQRGDKRPRSSGCDAGAFERK